MGKEASWRSCIQTAFSTPLKVRAYYQLAIPVLRKVGNVILGSVGISLTWVGFLDHNLIKLISDSVKQSFIGIFSGSTSAREFPLIHIVIWGGTITLVFSILKKLWATLGLLKATNQILPLSKKLQFNELLEFPMTIYTVVELGNLWFLHNDKHGASFLVKEDVLNELLVILVKEVGIVLVANNVKLPTQSLTSVNSQPVVEPVDSLNIV